MDVGRASSSRTGRPYLTDEGGPHPRAPCEACTERASGLARGTPPYMQHGARLRGIPAGFYPSLLPPPPVPLSLLSLISASRCLCRSWHQKLESSVQQWFKRNFRHSGKAIYGVCHVLINEQMRRLKGGGTNFYKNYFMLLFSLINVISKIKLTISKICF